MPDTTGSTATPSPTRLSEYAFSFLRTAALRAAVGLDVVTAVCEGHDTPPRLAERCGASERGMRALCDYLVALGLLAREGDHYLSNDDAAVFLNRHSPAFIGDALGFVASDTQIEATLKDPVALVRQGGSLLDGAGQLGAPDHPDWTTYASSMALMMARSSIFVAEVLGGDVPRRVLDIAAGPGQNGIELAKRHPGAHVTALDWPNVLEVARKNAEAAGVSERWEALPGSALEVPLAGPYDVVLAIRFLHLLSRPDCEALLRRIHAALAPQGRLVTMQVVLNDDRVSPPFAAMMNFNLLATTPSGQIYSQSELETLLTDAGFEQLEWHILPDSDERALLAQRGR